MQGYFFLSAVSWLTYTVDGTGGEKCVPCSRTTSLAIPHVAWMNQVGDGKMVPWWNNSVVGEVGIYQAP